MLQYMKYVVVDTCRCAQQSASDPLAPSSFVVTKSKFSRKLRSQCVPTKQPHHGPDERN